ncbi:MAG: hypothetical protein JOY56_07225, partial [Solirubrobacterales bacterium]|nr:hypothetical protein [Solirubrobacterales bacterium]
MTVQREDRQKLGAIEKISKQIPQLAKELRSDVGAIQGESEPNKELLELSRQTLALTKVLSVLVALGGGVANASLALTKIPQAELSAAC